MLACKGGAECQPHSPYRSSSSIFMPHTSSTTMTMAQMRNLSQQPKCGSDFAYLYFCSFVFLSSFLVGDEKSAWSIELFADLDAESLRCRHHGQLRLSHAWFVDLRCTSSRWISAGLVGVRSRWNVCSFECPFPHRIDSLSLSQRSFGIHENVRNASTDVPTRGFRNEMSVEISIQSTFKCHWQ